MSDFSKNQPKFLVAVLCLVMYSPALSQELNDLNLPQSGLTEDSLDTREELFSRMMELTTCAECSMIIGDQTYYGSNDYIRFGENGVSAVLNGHAVQFERFYVDQSDLSGCERYVGGKIVSGPNGLSGRFVDESLAFTFTGAQASLTSEANVIALYTTITWPRDPSNADFPAKLFVGDRNTVLLPFSGEDGVGLITKINELGRVCEKLGW